MTEEENPQQETPQPLNPLARDMNGNPIKLPASAVAWRVRRGGKRRGRPRNVFNADGQPLDVPIGGTLDDLIEGGCGADRYLLYPVDAAGVVIPGIVAMTEVPSESEEDESAQLPNRDVVAHLLATVKAQSDTLCRALEATAGGYGPVRPAQPQPIVLEQPAAPPQNEQGLKPDQIAQVIGMAKSVFDMFKGGGVPMGGGAPPAAAGP